MTDCADVRVRELLPDYLHDALGSGDSALVRLHLRGCAACREELRVLESSRRVLSLVPSVDVARIVSALPAPPVSSSPSLRLAPSSARGWGGVGAWRVAAAALLMVGAAGVVVGRGGHWPVTSPETSPQPRVSYADDAGAEMELNGVATLAFASELSELSDASIGELLAEVELMEALPAEDPRPMVLAGDVEPDASEEVGGT